MKFYLRRLFCQQKFSLVKTIYYTGVSDRKKIGKFLEIKKLKYFGAIELWNEY